MSITSPNADRFSKYFTIRLDSKFVAVVTKQPPHLKCVATVPRGIFGMLVAVARQRSRYLNNSGQWQFYLHQPAFTILRYFLQRAQLHCKRCISYGNSVRLSVCPSVCLSVRLSHAGIVSKRRNVARCSFHRWIAKCV